MRAFRRAGHVAARCRAPRAERLLVISLEPQSGEASCMEFPEALRAKLRTAEHVVVFTGAGVSAESGIPTFRDAQTGLWARFDPSELATPGAFARDPALVWGWYESRRGKVMRAEPNPAHRAIAALASRVSKLTLVTQNVDDLH